MTRVPIRTTIKVLQESQSHFLMPPAIEIKFNVYFVARTNNRALEAIILGIITQITTFMVLYHKYLMSIIENQK